MDSRKRALGVLQARMTIKDVGTQFNIRKSTITILFAQQYWVTNSVADQSRSGQHRKKTDQRTDRWMENKVLRN